jgi:hypothetical protein
MMATLHEEIRAADEFRRRLDERVATARNPDAERAAISAEALAAFHAAPDGPELTPEETEEEIRRINASVDEVRHRNGGGGVILG